MVTATTARPERRAERAEPLGIGAGTMLAGRYRLGAVLGTGGMSVVHEAHDTVLRRSVAVKVLRPQQERPGSSPGMAEAHLAAAVGHSALTAVFDAGTHVTGSGRRIDFIVMELVRGGDLRIRLLDGGPLSWRDVLWLGVDLSDGLARLHEAGYLHRDLKPANVLVVGRERDGRIRAKLADFGISSSRGAAPQDELGTAAYLSPEQVRGEVPTERSDVYSLGLVLLEALTGGAEFPGSPVRSALARLRHDPVVPASVPAPLAVLLRAMTAPLPSGRPTATAVGTRLREVLTAETVHARSAAPLRAERREAAWAHALGQIDVLAWPPERACSTATALARRVTVAPHAFVAIRSGRSVHVVSPSRGLELPDVLPASGWLVDPVQDGPWAIQDLAADARTRDDVAVLRQGARSFAGAPLIAPDGERLGTLCVLDGRRRPFSRQALEDLASVGSVILHELELRLAARRAVLAR